MLGAVHAARLAAGVSLIAPLLARAVQYFDVAPGTDECACFDIRTLKVYAGGRLEDCKYPYGRISYSQPIAAGGLGASDNFICGNQPYPEYSHMCADTCERFLGAQVKGNSRNYSDPIAFPALWDQAFPDSPASDFQAQPSAKPSVVPSSPAFRQALAEIQPGHKTQLADADSSESTPTPYASHPRPAPSIPSASTSNSPLQTASKTSSTTATPNPKPTQSKAHVTLAPKEPLPDSSQSSSASTNSSKSEHDMPSSADQSPEASDVGSRIRPTGEDATVSAFGLAATSNTSSPVHPGSTTSSPSDAPSSAGSSSNSAESSTSSALTVVSGAVVYSDPVSSGAARVTLFKLTLLAIALVGMIVR